MKTYELAYGKGTQTVSLPEEKVIYDLEGPAAGVEKDIPAAAREALRASGKFLPWQCYTISIDGNIIDE